MPLRSPQEEGMTLRSPQEGGMPLRSPQEGHTPVPPHPLGLWDNRFGPQPLWQSLP